MKLGQTLVPGYELTDNGIERLFQTPQIDDSYIEGRIAQYAEYARAHRRGIITHQQLLEIFAEECEVGEESLAGSSDFSSSVGSVLLQLGWREYGNGYEYSGQSTESVSADTSDRRTESQLTQMLGCGAGAHDWDF